MKRAQSKQLFESIINNFYVCDKCGDKIKPDEVAYEGLDENGKQIHICINCDDTGETEKVFESILKESYTCWDDFYKEGCRLGIKPYMTKLDILRDKYNGFKNTPKELIQDIIESIPDDNYEVFNFVEEMIDYFGFYD